MPVDGTSVQRGSSPLNAGHQARLEAGARDERTLAAVACRVEPVVAHPAPPQIRTCAIHAYGSSSRAAAAPGAVHWPAVVRVGELYVSPLSPASGCSARRRLPSRGSLGPHFPTFFGTMLHYDCPLPVSGRFACHSRPDTLRASVRSWCPHRARVRVEAPRARQGFWSSGPPFPGVAQGDRWLSQVPELPLEIHAPLSDPGGVPSARQSVSGTAAFRCQETVGFPLCTS